MSLGAIPRCNHAARPTESLTVNTTAFISHNATWKLPKLNIKPLDFCGLNLLSLYPNQNIIKIILVQWHIWITLSEQLNKPKLCLLPNIYRFVLQLVARLPIKEIHTATISFWQSIQPASLPIACPFLQKNQTHAFINLHCTNRSIFRLGKNRFILTCQSWQYKLAGWQFSYVKI